jgi:hypothetical protein
MANLIKISGGSNANIQGKALFNAAATPTYNIGRSLSAVNEGSSVTFTLSTTNVSNGTVLPYTITGISATDVTTGSLTGSFTVNSGLATTTITMSADQLTEGAETATLTLNNAAASNFVIVNDTSVFTPATISGLQLWLDASDTSTLYDATADGSLVTTDGATVARWQDKSGNNRHFTQSTANARPILNTSNQNGKNVVYFDGSNDYIAGSVTGFKSLSATTVIYVAKPVAAAAADTNSFIGWNWGNEASRALGVNATTSLIAGEYIMNNVSNGTQRRLASSTYRRTANTAQILTSTFSSAGTKLYVNSSEVTLNQTAGGASTTTNYSPAAIGYTVNDNVYLNSSTVPVAGPQNRVCEFLIYNSVLNAEQRTNVWNYLSAKWAI